ncbi:MAG: methyltransferase domain-containing protein [Candidatus Marinimicrobia bacterium]|nr:methyltransferase domain-containing protein [Candidatus Neomarinimicrobiota bacterium]
MNKDYFNIKDNCRSGLLKYLFKALSIIPVIENPLMLDVGCGSGVPTLALAENFNGTITAVDIDTKSINRLEEKIKQLDISNIITLHNCSLFEMKLEENLFDIILAEGFLNVVGFQKGFLKVIKLLKRNRFFIIHDEFRDHNKKTEFIESNNCKILGSFRLDEYVWWNDYYKCLEKEISFIRNKDFLELFKTDLHEIELFKQDPSQFNSVY